MTKVMTVDNSALARTIIKNILKNGGFSDIIEASNGQEAVDKFKLEKPDLVLLDIVLDNGIDGIDTLKAIKKIDPNARIIMVSVIDQPAVIENATKLGARGFITKPVSIESLMDAIKKCLESDDI